jgi:hypothetical protein
MTNLHLAPLKVAIIGCGRPHGTAGATGFGMAHRHRAGFTASARAPRTAVARAVRFAERSR